jgi:hypothetical protein
VNSRETLAFADKETMLSGCRCKLFGSGCSARQLESLSPCSFRCTSSLPRTDRLWVPYGHPLATLAWSLRNMDKDSDAVNGYGHLVNYG